MRTQLLPPFVAADFKCKLLEIMCHVARALLAWRGPFNIDNLTYELNLQYFYIG